MKFESKLLRKVASSFATGITVVTLNKPDGTMHGMTASSFLSVSLDPPLVSFCVKGNATIYKHLEIGKPVGISILSGDQEHISSHFAGMKESDQAIITKTLSSGVQVIESALATYGTIVNKMIRVGDHYLILCEIKELERTSESKPLIYWSGYKTIK